MRSRVFTFLCVLTATALSHEAGAQNSAFYVQVDPVQSASRYGEIAQWFATSRYLENATARLNQQVQLPRSVRVGAGECNTTNAFFRPTPEPPTVIICYEMVAAIANEFRLDRLTPQQLDAATMGTLDFILYHEIGHSLVHVLNLPITGREEDAVDQFATVVLTRNNPDATVWAARFFKEFNDPGHLGLKRWRGIFRNAFADEHSLDEQRFFNILCWTYGASPTNRQRLLSAIPPARAARCPGEYQQLASSWSRLLASHTTATMPSTPERSLAGSWKYSERLVQQANALSCDDRGTIWLQSTGSSYMQTGTCVMNGRTVDNPGHGALSNVTISSNRVLFRMENCDYDGVVTRASPVRVEGTVKCDPEQGQTEGITGVWAAEQ
jgi:hypothetical protein